MTQVFLRHADGAIESRENASLAALKSEFNGAHLTVGGVAVDELSADQIIDINPDLLGAGKKRKKKNYTKPKKTKRKHKKVKLAVLKFYKVDGGDKVQRLRKSCPNCGNGIMM